MALVDLIARVRDFIDEPTQQNFTDAQIIRAINVAQQDVAKEITHEYEDYFEKQYSFSTTTATLYSFATISSSVNDILKFKRLERSDTGQTIPFIDINEKIAGNSLVPVVTSSVGLQAYIMDTNIGLTPSPTAGIPMLATVVYRLADLVNPADISSIPVEHQDLLAVMASIDMFIKDESDISQLQNLRDWKMEQLKRTLRQRQIQEPKRVRRVDTEGVLW